MVLDLRRQTLLRYGFEPPALAPRGVAPCGGAMGGSASGRQGAQSDRPVAAQPLTPGAFPTAALAAPFCGPSQPQPARSRNNGARYVQVGLRRATGRPLRLVRSCRGHHKPD